jgi:hypothetical protein
MIRVEMAKDSSNISKCGRCQEWIIAEEYSQHKCHSKSNTMFYDTDGTFSFDGIKWYKWLPTRSEQQNKTRDYGTEPKSLMI